MSDDSSKRVTGEERDPIDEMMGMFASRERAGGMKMKRDLSWQPPVDIIETETELVVLVEIPGMTAREIDVVTDGRQLKIRGSRKTPHPTRKIVFHQVEIMIGRFERVIDLPAEIDASRISARYEKGFLRIKSRKKPVKERERRIDIR